MGYLKTNSRCCGEIATIKNTLKTVGQGLMAYYTVIGATLGTYINFPNMSDKNKKFFNGSTCIKACKLLLFGGLRTNSGGVYSYSHVTLVHNTATLQNAFNLLLERTIKVGDTVYIEIDTDMAGAPTLLYQLIDADLLV